MNIPLIVAGSFALLGAVIHGGVGDLLVVRPLSLNVLPSTQFGGPRMTKLMIRVTWHITTIAFLTVGCALVLAGSVLEGDVARALTLLAALASTGFAVLALIATFGRCGTRVPSCSRPSRRWRGPD